MKQGIHPRYSPVVFVDGDAQIVTRSTLKSAETRKINGVEHFVVQVNVSSYSHPFFTGKQKLVDTEGRIERFNKKYRRDAKDSEAKTVESKTVESKPAPKA